MGKRFMVAATEGVAQHELLTEGLRCESRFLKHRDLLESGNGLFKPKLRERMVMIKFMKRIPQWYFVYTLLCNS